MKIKEIKTKYLNKLPSHIIDEAISLDSTPTKKYVDYALTQYIANYSYSLFDIFMMIKTFEEYKSYIENKDIYSSEYKSLDNLINTTKFAKYNSELKEYKKELASDIFILDENENYILLHPKTHDAARKYGYNTRWCVTSSDDRHYRTYSKNLIFLINKKGSPKYLDKVAFWGDIDRIHVYDSLDESHNLYFFDYMFKEQYDTKKIIKITKKFMNRHRFAFIKKYLPWTLVHKIGY